MRKAGMILLAGSLGIGIAQAQTTVPVSERSSFTPSSDATASTTSSSTSTRANAAKKRTAIPLPDGHDPLLDLPALPKGSVTLLGGTVKSIDQVRDHLTVEPFGGKSQKLVFDERTHFYRDGKETTQSAIRKGDRVYIDTMLDGTQIFARNVRVMTQLAPADARGRVMNFDLGSGELILQDELSSQPVKLMVNSATRVTDNNRAVSISDLKSDSLVTVKFAPQRHNEVAQEVNILAAPGASFAFLGMITYLDLIKQILGVENESDKKIYDIKFTPTQLANRESLHEGANASIQAIFNGDGYTARSIQILPNPTR